MSDENSSNPSSKKTAKPRLKIRRSTADLSPKPPKRRPDGDFRAAPDSGPASVSIQRNSRPSTPLAGQIDLLTLRQIADHLQVCVRTVRRTIVRNAIPVVWINNRMRVRIDHLVLFLKQHR